METKKATAVKADGATNYLSTMQIDNSKLRTFLQVNCTTESILDVMLSLIMIYDLITMVIILEVMSHG